MDESLMLPFEEPERWLPVPGWEDLYLVSDLGRVKSLHTHGRGKRGGVLSQSSTPDGRKGVTLSRAGKTSTRLVHQLVLEAFIGPCPAGEESLHGPGGCGDNRLVNLEWGTKAKNCGPDKRRDGTDRTGEDSPVAKLTDDIVMAMRLRYASGETHTVLAADYGISTATVSLAVRGKRWGHVAHDVPIPEFASSGEGHVHAKLTWPTVREIRARYAAGGISQMQLAREYGVRQATLWSIVAGRTWKEVDRAS